MSRRKFLTEKASRSEKDYGLPRLTVEEFAREVGVQPDEITVWLGKLLHRKVIDHARWSRWTLDREPISPALVRLFLVQRLEDQGATSERQPLRPVGATPKKNLPDSGKRGARS